LETFLYCFASEQPTKWHMWLSWAEFWYNTSSHSATGKSPFEIVWPSPSLCDLVFDGETKVDSVATVLFDCDEALRQLKFHLNRAQQTKKYADAHCCHVTFVVGDWVYVKLRPHKQQSRVCWINPKLSPSYFGPFQVIYCVGAVAYKLQLPDSTHINLVFHVSQHKSSL